MDFFVPFNKKSIFLLGLFPKHLLSIMAIGKRSLFVSENFITFEQLGFNLVIFNPS